MAQRMVFKFIQTWGLVVLHHSLLSTSQFLNITTTEILDQMIVYPGGSSSCSPSFSSLYITVSQLFHQNFTTTEILDQMIVYPGGSSVHHKLFNSFYDLSLREAVSTTLHTCKS